MIESVPPVVLVTGATGFLGRAVVARLRRAGIPVRAAGGPTASTHAADVALDLRSDTQIAAAVRDAAAIIHLAAVGGPQSMRDTVATADVNALGTQRLARAAHAPPSAAAPTQGAATTAGRRPRAAAARLG